MSVLTVVSATDRLVDLILNHVNQNCSDQNGFQISMRARSLLLYLGFTL